MIDRRGFIASIFAHATGKSLDEAGEPGSKKAHCKVYWTDEANKIWGLTHRGEVIEIHHHAVDVKNLAARP